MIAESGVFSHQNLSLQLGEQDNRVRVRQAQWGLAALRPIGRAQCAPKEFVFRNPEHRPNVFPVIAGEKRCHCNSSRSKQTSSPLPLTSAGMWAAHQKWPIVQSTSGSGLGSSGLQKELFVDHTSCQATDEWGCPPDPMVLPEPVQTALCQTRAPH